MTHDQRCRDVNLENTDAEKLIARAKAGRGRKDVARVVEYYESTLTSARARVEGLEADLAEAKENPTFCPNCACTICRELTNASRE